MAVTANKMVTHGWAVEEFKLDVKFLDGSSVPRQLLGCNTAKNYGLTVAGSYANNQCVKQSDLSKPDSGGGDKPIARTSYTVNITSKLTNALACTFETDATNVSPQIATINTDESEDIQCLVNNKATGTLNIGGNETTGHSITLRFKDKDNKAISVTYEWDPSSNSQGNKYLLLVNDTGNSKSDFMISVNYNIEVGDDVMKLGTLTVHPDQYTSIVITINAIPQMVMPDE